MSNPGPTRQFRRKGSGARTWVVLGAGGEREEVEAGRPIIMRRTGLTARDLRILDPSLSYPSTIVGRERAIVINLEHIKAIITAHDLLLLNARDPSVIPFVDQLRHRILRFNDRHQDHANRMQDAGIKVLPFEFLALEACLEAACSALEYEEKILAQEANIDLENLTSVVNTLNLERVRHIKSRLVAITGRVQKVKGELEKLLDNDEDMSQMYLTNKLVQQPLETSSTSSSRNDGDEKENQVLQPDINGSAVTKKPDVEELEKMLEAYFVQIGGILNKLFAMKEYVENTEEYVNMLLDEKQNKLLQMECKLNTVNVIVEAFITVTGILAINVDNHLFNINGRYFWTIGTCLVTSILLYVTAIAWYKRKRLLY